MNGSLAACGPRIVDRYQRLSLIGSGGQCEVFRCFDPIADQWVALKRLMLDGTNREEDQQRFLREPDAMNCVMHPTVPVVYDVAVDAWPKPYFTMEVLEAIDLRRVLYGLRNEVQSIQDSFPLERLIDVVIRVGEGLQEAHNQGFIHRDVKPENIMVTSTDEVKLVDWGTAKRFGQEEACVTWASGPDGIERRLGLQVTQEGFCPGTPLYMSPEQIIGPVRGQCQLDARSDVFALGAVLYDCLALTTLISGSTIDEVFYRTLHGPYLPPSTAGRRSHVPASLEEVCMNAVAIDRDQRYPSVEAFCSDLERALDDSDLELDHPIVLTDSSSANTFS
jgi:eukaryotic-like serine/threonine-protein kinase